MDPLQMQPLMVYREGILHKGPLARNPWCSRRRRIDAAEISTPVTVDQRAATCLEDAVRSFTAMRSRCRSSRADVIFHRPLISNSYHCGTDPLHTISYCAIRKSSFLKADNPA
ncbi:uncharacterized protein TNCV_2490991 [Trichonephila clavipes]|nr:uncharacterized protein TNCV_2490991 [Trichonephila clavipes]